MRVRETARLGAIVLSERMLPRAAGRRSRPRHPRRACASTACRCCHWSKEAETLRQRLAWLHRGLGAPWPDVSDAALLAALDDWLLPFLTGEASFAAHRSGARCRDGLMSLVPHDLQRKIGALAPTHFDAPSGQPCADPL